MSQNHPYNPEETVIEGTMLLEASAGTGKTYALERLVTRLIGQEKNPLRITEILVVTYTKRAAREMRERIRKLLSERAHDSHRSARECEQYHRALGEFDQASIDTIHAFCQKVLRTWPFESAAPFHQEMEPGIRLEREETRHWLAGFKANAVEREYLAAAYKKEGGSEKLINVLAQQLSDDSVPAQSRLIPSQETLTKVRQFIVECQQEGGGDLRRQLRFVGTADWSNKNINDLLKGTALYKRSKTAAAMDTLRQHVASCTAIVDPLEGIRALLDPKRGKIRAHFLNVFYAGVACGLGILSYQDGPNDSLQSFIKILVKLYQIMEPMLELVPEKKEVRNLMGGYISCAFQESFLKDIQAKVEERKDESGQWGYKDLIQRVAERVTGKNKESPLSRLLRRSYKAALIDEFQDTDPQQWALFYNLFGEAPHILVLIGDPKQSIYGFRGTGLQAYRKARDIIPPSKRYRLDKNYRSSPALVEATNHFFHRIFKQSADGNEAVGFEKVASAKEKNDKLLWPGSALNFLSLHPEKGEKIHNLATKAIVAEIQALLDPENGAKWRRPNKQEESVTAADIAILVRGKKEKDDVLKHLEIARIPSLSLDNNSVFSQPIIPPLLGLLEAFDAVRHTALWRAVLLDSFFGLTADLLEYCEQAGYLDELMERSEGWRENFEKGQAMKTFHSFFLFSSTLGSWVLASPRPEEAPRLSQSWEERVLASPNGERQWQDWRQICELIQEKQSKGMKNITDIKAWIKEQSSSPSAEDSSDTLRLESEDPAVKVLTMHASKGLEFPLVFLHGGYTRQNSALKDTLYRFEENHRLVVDRIKHHAHKERHLAYQWEENKRLWYVGFTRASVRTWLPRPCSEEIFLVDSLYADALGLVAPPLLASASDSRGEGKQPHLRLPLHLDEKSHAPENRKNLDKAFETLSHEYPELFTLATARPLLPPRPLVLARKKIIPAPLPTDDLVKRDPQTSSYTSLVRGSLYQGEGLKILDNREDFSVKGESENASAQDAVVLAPLIDDSEIRLESLSLPLASDGGILFGNLVHALFEKVDFYLVKELSPSQWLSDERVEKKFHTLASFYYSAEWYLPRAHVLKNLIRSTLRASIPRLGRLCDLPEKMRRHELDFFLTIPKKTDIISGESMFFLENGLLKGVMDLLVKSENQWWIIDWKTNLPPQISNFEGYKAEFLEEMMESHHYHLQYRLYLLALVCQISRYRASPVDWDKEIAGAVYLFIRGMCEETTEAIFIHKPSLEEMQDLASRMGLEGIVV